MKRAPLPETTIVRLYQQGVSEQALALDYGVARSVIRRRLLAHGIAIRGRHEAELAKWAQMPEDWRAHQVAAAHEAATGRTPSEAERHALALTRQQHGVMTADERRLHRWLCDDGLQPIPQQAVGPYNCDIGCWPVDIELHGGNWHATGAHARRAPNRAAFLLSQGWSVLIVHVAPGKGYPLTRQGATAITAFVHDCRALRTGPACYCVMRGDGMQQPLFPCSALPLSVF